MRTQVKTDQYVNDWPGGPTAGDGIGGGMLR